MVNFLRFRRSDKKIGFFARNVVDGPESEMLKAFVRQYAEEIRTDAKHYALFYEPLVPTGYPDLVVVQYSPAIYDHWERHRMSLQVSDLKILHHLHFVHGATSGLLRKKLGIECQQLFESLERLMDAKLVNRKEGAWMPTNLKNVYGIRRIKAIEAKISDWGNVLKQADVNRLFASESYILSPVANPSPHIVAQAHEKGVGIFSLPKGEKFKTLQKPACMSGLPVSYASWLFNEWIGRKLAQGERMAQ